VSIQRCSEAPACMASNGRKRGPYLGKSCAPSSTPAMALATRARRRGRGPPRIARSGPDLEIFSWHRATARQEAGDSLLYSLIYSFQNLSFAISERHRRRERRRTGPGLRESTLKRKGQRERGRRRVVNFSPILYSVFISARTHVLSNTFLNHDA
jgi:hypothetical protein